MIAARLLLLAAVLAAVACSKVALTGRSQLLLVPDSQVAELSRQSRTKFFEEAERQHAIVKPQDADSSTVLPMVERLSSRIIRAAGLEKQAQWRVVVVRSKEVNANASADGTIVVYTGILPVAESEAGLAVIVAHEVAHVVARHSGERLSQMLVAQGVTNMAAALASPQYQAPAAAALGLGSQYGVLLPFSRHHESEADHLGIYYMAKAGYDPAEAPRLWERMSAKGKSSTPEFMSTHPSDATRIAQLRAWLPDARRYYEDQSLPLPAVLGR
ncbi:MAG TPA: M48 family metallopeptidase [Methylomirabilota bacterium]